MKINIIEHRTGWCESLSTFNDKSLQNTKQGFIKSFSRGNGVETDIRDIKGDLVISHDMPSGNELSFEDMLKIYNKYNCKGILALNVKCDGMQNKIKDLLTKYSIENYFMFDMSIPDSLGYLEKEIISFVRDSEHEVNPKESTPIIYRNSQGVWIDQFKNGNPTRINYNLVKDYLDDGKYISIVSPELHPWGRTDEMLYKKAWVVYKDIFSKLSNKEILKVSICTDFPEQATNFFNK